MSCGHLHGRVQISRAVKLHIGKEHKSKGYQLVLCTREPSAFRAHLHAHVATMEPLGFNAHALGVLASRHLRLLLAKPQALAERYAMLRDVFGSCADDLADDIRRTDITPECLPAIAHDACNASCGRSTGSAISCLHKAMLSGPDNMLTKSREGIEEQLRRLVAAGLVFNEAEARRACMQRPQLNVNHTLQWMLERRAAVQAVGGSPNDVRVVCCRNASMPVVLRGLLFWKQVRCAFELSSTI